MKRVSFINMRYQSVKDKESHGMIEEIVLWGSGFSHKRYHGEALFLIKRYLASVNQVKSGKGKKKRDYT
jgi:hypothetical protein